MTDQEKTAASASLLAVMEKIRRFFPEWPPVLPSEANSQVRPLAVGIDKDLATRIVVPEGMSVTDVETEVQRAIRYLVRSYSYHRAVSTPGAMRHGIDGEPFEPVTPEQAEHARRQLPEFKRSTPSATTSKEVIVVKIQHMKITVVLQPEQIRVIPETLREVDLTLDMGDGRPCVAPFSGKNWRRARRQIDEILGGGGEAVVILQGRLIAGGRIEGAGLAVQSKTPKAG